MANLIFPTVTVGLQWMGSFSACYSVPVEYCRVAIIAGESQAVMTI